ncbi:MAG: cell division protein FtsA [Spirosomataceae bacterium]
MNNDKPYIVGLDIGSTKICAIAAQQNNLNQLDIKGLIEEKIGEGAVQNSSIANIEQATKAIDKVLEALSSRVPADVMVVNVNISGDAIKGRRELATTTGLNGESMQITDLTNMARDVQRTYLSKNTDQLIVHSLPQEFTIDGITTIENPIGRVGVQFAADFYLITIKSAIYKLLKNTITNIKGKEIEKDNYNNTPNLDINSVIFSPLADSLAVIDDNDRRSGIAVVNIGGDTTEVAIYHRKGLKHIAVLPYGGRSITEDLEQGLHIYPESAEKLKYVSGLAPSKEINPNEIITIRLDDGRVHRISAKNAAIIIEERLKEIAAMVVAEITRAGYSGMLNSGIILTGGTAKMPLTEAIFKHVCRDFHVRIGNPNRYVTTNGGLTVTHPKYATVIGLALAAFKRLDERVPASILELVVDDYRSQVHQTPQQPQPERKTERPAPQPEKNENGGGFFGRMMGILNKSIPADDHINYTEK